MPDLSPKAVKFFEERVDWQTSERDQLENRSKLYKWGAISGWAFAIISIAAVIPLVQLHEFTPIMVLVDRITGDYEVRVGKQKINTEDKRNEARMVADIAKHVRARESFTRGEAEQNYRVVFNQLDESLRAEWTREYVSSPDSPIKKYGLRDQIKLANESIQWLPSTDSLPNHRIAQYRFDKVRKIDGKVPTRQPYVATLTFTYSTDNIPKILDDLVTNPFGFAVANYRADPAGPEKVFDEKERGAR
jgi:type IV secretion system protein VirB8